MTFIIKEKEAIPTVSQQIIDAIGHHKVWLLKGRVGAGKTTLLKSVGKHLGVLDEITSPTYALVNEYSTDGSNELIYHIDLYRLKSLEEAWNAGLEEYLFSGQQCWIEWPELLSPLKEDLDATEIDITILPDSSRKVLILEYE